MSSRYGEAFGNWEQYQEGMLRRNVRFAVVSGDVCDDTAPELTGVFMLTRFGPFRLVTIHCPLVAFAIVVNAVHSPLQYCHY
jgi:hypothetical protein